MKRTLGIICFILCVHAFATAGEIRGRITDSATKEALIGATVMLEGTTMGGSTDTDGSYLITNVPEGTYIIRCAIVGYVTGKKKITVGADPMTIDFSLVQTVIESDEVVVEVNRARERETPVAFSTVGKMDIQERISGQDAPLLVKTVPGVYAFSTDGVGNGEARLFVRGFDQNHVQVLINGVPTNDPESNSVYWSNWGSVSSAAASVQVQRGAGSSLYGSGAFGGSFNVITSDAPANSYYGVNLNLGDPMNTMYGLDAKTGIIDNTIAAAVRIDRKIAEGSRVSGRYEGVNYYTSLSFFPAAGQTLKFVLHGAPQEHGYSFSNDISYFKIYGYEANSAPFLPRDVVSTFRNNATDGIANYALLDDTRELVDDKYVNLSHNFFHKPQAELHYRYDLDEVSSVNTTFFYSMGRGGGSSLNSAGTTFARSSSNTITTYLAPDGVLTNRIVADTLYLRPAFQRTSYSLHQQWGVLANYDTKLSDNLRATFGGEYRSWSADHPGHFTNLYGKTSITSRYAVRDTAGNVTGATFSRRNYQGDLNGPSDLGSIFAWDLANNDPTYRSQYRNYLGETPQYTLFAQANFQATEQLNILASLQYVWYKYRIVENMPSESAIGRLVPVAEAQQRGLSTEGPTGTGKFLMQGTNTRWYEFDLVDADRSRGFLQPKAGANFNVSENFNVFANFAHVERFVDLGVYYNQGLINPEADDEKSNQYEFGAGWRDETFSAKLNGYLMDWDNRTTRIQDVSKAGQPGYDRNGFRSELIGSSTFMGVEFEGQLELGKILPITGFSVTASLAVMDNEWTTVLDEVKTNPNGTRRIFNDAALNASGQRDTLYFDELENTPVASQAQIIGTLGLNYRNSGFFAGITMSYFDKHYALDGGTYVAVDGSYNAGNNTFSPAYSDKLPSATVFDFQTGYGFNVVGIRANAALQVLNIFGTEYLASSDRFGVIPGILRSVRFNLSAGI